MYINIFQQAKNGEIFINKYRGKDFNIAKSKDFYGNMCDYKVSDEMFIGVYQIKKSSWNEIYDKAKKIINNHKN